MQGKAHTPRRCANLHPIPGRPRLADRDGDNAGLPVQCVRYCAFILQKLKSNNQYFDKFRCKTAGSLLPFLPKSRTMVAENRK